MKTYDKANDNYAPDRSSKIAWVAVKDKFRQVEDKWVARSEDFVEFNTTRFVFTAVEDSLVRSDNGGFTRDFVLATANPIKGIALSQVALKRMAEQINSEKLKGRLTTHDVMRELERRGLSPEQIEAELQSIEEGIEAVQAVVDGDRLKARIMFTPDAYEKAKDYKAVSIEARYPVESVKDNTVHQARLTGFILTNEPADAGAVEESFS